MRHHSTHATPLLAKFAFRLANLHQRLLEEQYGWFALTHSSTYVLQDLLSSSSSSIALERRITEHYQLGN